MRFDHIKKRENWQKQAEEFGYLVRILDNPPYWVEALENPFCAVLSEVEITEVIEVVSRELYKLSLDTVNHIVNSRYSDKYFDLLKIPAVFRAAVRKSWRRGDLSLYGRFDFAYQNGQIKLLELNFDTPTSLYEASVLQKLWLEDLKCLAVVPANCSQFNSLHAKLIDAFKRIVCNDSLFHLTTMEGSFEDEDTVRYIQSCAMQAGLTTDFIYLKDIGLGKNAHLIDFAGKHIEKLFKLYPWEFIVEEELVFENKYGCRAFPKIVESSSTIILEPLWKLILSNKGILPIMWQLYPNHPNLLETYFDDQSAQAKKLKKQPYVRKPIFGREGGSVSIVTPGQPEMLIHNNSSYGKEGFIVQEYFPLPCYEQYYTVMGCWIINGQPAAIGLRADLNPITSNGAIFLPHYVEAVA